MKTKQEVYYTDSDTHIYLHDTNWSTHAKSAILHN